MTFSAGPGLIFEAHAGVNYLDFGLVDGLLAAGAQVDRPAQGLGIFEQQAFYSRGIRPRRASAPRGTARRRTIAPGAGGKYAPLAQYLDSQSRAEVEMGFDEVEVLVGTLPSSASNHRAWWANDETHAQARSWLGAGWKVTHADPARGRVRFEMESQ